MRDFIPMAVPYVGIEEAEAARRQVRSGWLSMGRRTRELESLLAEYLGVAHVTAVSSGTAALHSALLALGVSKGDDVLVPCLSYVSSANAVLYCGARPVFIEEDPLTLTVTAEGIEDTITSKTKAIMVVDAKGMPPDYDAVRAVAEARGVKILADSAEAFGSAYKGSPVGSQAAIHSFSMFSNKTITCGEGGFTATNESSLGRICELVRNQGQSQRYVHEIVGHNYRLTDVAASIAIEQLRRIDWLLAQRERVAQFYTEYLADCALVRTPNLPDYVTQLSWYAYCVTVAPQVDRDRMVRGMLQRGVDYRVAFPPIPLQPVYRRMFGYRQGDFKRAEAIYKRFIDIPCWVGMTAEQMERVVATVKRCAEDAYGH